MRDGEVEGRREKRRRTKKRWRPAAVSPERMERTKGKERERERGEEKQKQKIQEKHTHL